MAHHEFTPTVYHRTLGSHPAVLRVAPGDTVSTWTIDARGYDHQDRQVWEPGNPMTGPFAVDGARAGDTLAVTFERITPNRALGLTSPRIAAGALEPGYPVTHAEEGGLCTWEIDVAAGTARLVEPASALSGLALPLAPMLGCFGVAPSGGQAISTATSSTHGGNMDYRGFCAGATVYLPVSEPGGLFFLGDGHALQGDGEIVGTGVEVSMDVTFRLDLLRDHAITWPRAENANYLMTVGNARPLDQCVQHATTEMLVWLESEYGLAPLVAHSLLGQCVEYDLANMFDPAYTVVCKLPKRVLVKLAG